MLTAERRDAILLLSRELIDLDMAPAFDLMKEAVAERLGSDEHRRMADEFVARLRGRR